MGRHAKDSLKLSDAEIERAFTGKWGDLYPPVLNLSQAAELADVSKKTIYDWSHRGRLTGCASKTGKRLRVFRDRFVRFLFQAKE